MARKPKERVEEKIKEATDLYNKEAAVQVAEKNTKKEYVEAGEKLVKGLKDSKVKTNLTSRPFEVEWFLPYP